MGDDGCEAATKERMTRAAAHGLAGVNYMSEETQDAFTADCEATLRRDLYLVNNLLEVSGSEDTLRLECPKNIQDLTTL